MRNVFMTSSALVASASIAAFSGCASTSSEPAAEASASYTSNSNVDTASYTQAAEPYAQKHASNLWRTDAEATMALVIEEKPEMAEDLEGLSVQDVLGVYDVMLELASNGAYLMHLRSAGRTIESEGAWRRVKTESGPRVRLTPNRTPTTNEEVRAIIRSWVIHFDEDGRSARIESLSGVDTLLVFVD